MRFARLCFLFLALIVAFSCETAARNAPGREITTLRLRGGYVEVHAGPDVPTYTLLDAEQRPIAERLTAEDLKSRYPDRFAELERGLADEGVIIDASAPSLKSSLTRRQSLVR